MEKVIRDGKVAILYSPGFSAGWFTWNRDYKELLYHPKIVAIVEAKRQKELTEEWVKDNLGIDVYTGGAKNLEIKWLPEGTAFKIDDYDGLEEIITIEDLTLIA